MDGISAQAVAQELDQLLAGARVDRLSMPDRQRLCLTFYNWQRAKYSLDLLAHPGRPALSLAAGASGQGLDRPPSFLSLLRKYLGRARLISLTTPPFERVFILTFLGLDELGDEREFRLLFECMPRTANLILLNQDQIILGALRTVDHRVNRVREILPAHPYIPPPAQTGPDPFLCAEDPGNLALESLTGGPLNSRTLVRAVTGFSPVLAQEAIWRAGPDPTKQALASALQAVCRDITQGPPSPALYLDGREDEAASRPVAWHVIPLTHLPYRIPFDKAWQAMTEYNRRIEKTDLFNQRSQAISKRIQDRIRHVHKKRQVHEADVAEGREAAGDQLKGQLILAWIHTIPAGSSGLDLPDYHQEGKMVFCPLDPRKSPAENANLYYQKAKRKARKLTKASRLLEQDLDELNWLLSLLAAADRAESQDDLAAVEHEFSLDKRKADRPPDDDPASMHFPGKPASKKRKKLPASGQAPKAKKARTSEAQEPPLGPRRFRSSDGLLILSGRNNLQNDRLLRKAGRQDLWFHVRDLPGSHVILSSQGGQIPERALVEAASIAAWYSGAGRAGGAVEVDYCPVSQVRKIPGARPGNVTYQASGSLYVKAEDPRLLEDLVRDEFNLDGQDLET